MVSYNTFMADKNCSMCRGEGYIGLRYQKYPCHCIKATELKITENMSDTDKENLLQKIHQFIATNPIMTTSVHQYLEMEKFIKGSEKVYQELYDKIHKSQVPPDPEFDQIISSNIKEISKHGFTEPDKNCDICGGSGFIDNGTYNCVCTDAFKPITSTSDPKFKQKIK